MRAPRSELEVKVVAPVACRRSDRIDGCRCCSRRGERHDGNQECERSRFFMGTHSTKGLVLRIGPIRGYMIEPIDLEPLFPDRASGEGLGAQLLRRLRGAVESGFFPAGSRLLPSRELAQRLGVSRNTVVTALEQLIAEGYLEARIGAGTFVTDALHKARERSVARPRPLPTSPSKLAAVKERLDAAGSTFGPLRVGAPDLCEVPVAHVAAFETPESRGCRRASRLRDSGGIRSAAASDFASYRAVSRRRCRSGPSHRRRGDAGRLTPYRVRADALRRSRRDRRPRLPECECGLYGARFGTARRARGRRRHPDRPFARTRRVSRTSRRRTNFH